MSMVDQFGIAIAGANGARFEDDSTRFRRQWYWQHFNQ
jgi:hypothetical protein